MADKLTAQQQMAVTNRGGNLLVSAAAGSGKTKVLVERLMSYITDPVDPANIDDFLIITYTKAAAAELRAKIAARLNDAIAEQPGNRHLQRQAQRLYLAKISTVHSFCTDILREYAHRLDISADFRMMDEAEAPELQARILEKVIDRAYERIAADPAIAQLIDTQGYGRSDQQIPEIILKVYNSSRCHLDPEKWLDWCVSSSGTVSVTDAAQTVWGAYLMEDLHRYLDMQIGSLTKCVELAQAADGMEKPADILAQTVAQLVTLRNCETWDDVVANRNIDYGTLRFSKAVTDISLAEQIKMVREACKKGVSAKLVAFSAFSHQVLSELHSASTAARGLVDLVREFAGEYDKLKKARKMMDFSDLEHRMLDLILGKGRYAPNSIAREIGERFREVMVDEYQDSNQVQDAIFSALTMEKNNCFMVGDVKQSIYQFRLADPGIFIDKYNTYVPAEDARSGEGRKIILSNNFRSSKGVIGGVNDVFAQCMSPNVGGLYYGEEEMLYEGIPHIPLNDPEVSLFAVDVQEDTYAEEAAFVADKIRFLIDGTHHIRQGDTLRPITPEDIVILLRSPGSVGGEFVYALQSRGISCTTGDSEDLLQTKEVSVLVSFLRVLCNPLQDIPLLAVLTSNVFCYTADELAHLRGRNRNASVYHLLQMDETEKSRIFIEMLDELRSDSRIYGLTQLIQRILQKTGFDSIYSAMPDGDQRVAHIHSFLQLVSDYEANGTGDLGMFLDHLDAVAQRGLLKTQSRSAGGAVRIMSIHKSKGLEFPVVFLCGLSRRFNQESATAQILCDKQLGLGLCCLDAQTRVRFPSIARRAIACKMISESISEEMRVLYVAMTRARDRLIMTYADAHLDTTLQRLASRLPITQQELMTGYVANPGSWVLQTALMRTEAGALFAIGGNPGCSRVRDIPWEIAVVSAQVEEECERVSEENVQQKFPYLEEMKRTFSFRYPNMPATQMPSKQTATQLKGRLKDAEISQHTKELSQPVYFRKPSFIDPGATGQEYGNAYHAVMQYLLYENCQTLSGVEGELSRLKDANLITDSQRTMVRPDRICAFFSTDIGKKVLKAENVEREFKFSILVDPKEGGTSGEKVLLQGVVDCMLIEPDGITVIDFKTDRVNESNIAQHIEKHTAQLDAYASAVERIFRKPVKEKILYFFSCNQAVSL